MTRMATLRRLGPDDWETFRDDPARGLADSPDAFGSTLAREQAYGEDDWRRRLTGPVYVVEDPRPGRRRRHLRQRRHRRTSGACGPTPPTAAAATPARILDALIPPDPRPSCDVNITNGDARAVYERYGFVGTGEVEPLRPGLRPADRADGAAYATDGRLPAPGGHREVSRGRPRRSSRRG